MFKSKKQPRPKEAKEERTGDDFPPINDLGCFLKRAKSEFVEKWASTDIPRASLSDFERFRTLGAGAFGRVLLVKHKPSNTICAMKVLDKAKIVQTNQIDHTFYEMKILISIRFPFLVYMLYVMKDNSYLYFTMPFIIGGEMFGHLRKVGRFDEDQAKFYAAQVCLGLEYLQFVDVVYRDLKPENIMIDSRGYLKITDMGFCKIVKGRTYTFCGTPEYIAPEIILHKGYGKSADWWSYGVLLYEMSAGYTPFYAHDAMQIYEKIIAGKYRNSSHIGSDLRDLISGILRVDTTKRLGCLKNGANDIKNHKWFKNMNWLGILNRKVEAPYKPKYANELDCTNFDNIPETPLKVSDSDKYEKEFKNF